MHRGASNPDYHRAAVHAPYRPPPPAVRPPFSDPFSRPTFPAQFRGPIGPPSYPNPNPSPSPRDHLQAAPYHAAASGDPFYEHSQLSQGWTSQHLDLQNLEVRKKAEEFLRILEDKDRLELSSESVDRGHRNNNDDDEKDSRIRSKSRARSRARSKSRGRSRSRSRSRGRSRGKSRARSRSRSRSRGKSRTRAKSRPRSRSRSQSRSAVRSKSQPRLGINLSRIIAKEPSRSCSGTSSSSGLSPLVSSVPDLFQGLRQVLQSKELEKHLAVVKSTLLRNQILDEIKVMPESQPTMSNVQKFQELTQKLRPPEQPADFSFGQSVLLPHELVRQGDHSFPRILSWNDPSSQPEVRSVFPTVEDEEEFLYGEEGSKSKPQGVTVPLAQSRHVQSPVETLVSPAESTCLTTMFPGLSSSILEPVSQPAPSRQATDGVKVTPDECEKIRNLLKTIGLNLGMADIYKMAVKLKQKQVEQKEAAPVSGLAGLKPMLEALQALSKAPKSDGSSHSGSSHSHKESDQNEKQSEQKEKEREREREKREKQIQMKRKEYLVKELEGLLKQEGSGDLIPVIGFFCQRCEEFFGDLSSAERHAASHAASHKQDSTETKKIQDRHDQPKDPKDPKEQGDHHQKPYPDHREQERVPVPDKRSAASRIYQDYRERSPERKRARDERTPPSSSSQGPDRKSKEKDETKAREEDKAKKSELSKSERKKKKKEKKMKKKKKKEKKEKKKKEKENKGK